MNIKANEAWRIAKIAFESAIVWGILGPVFIKSVGRSVHAAYK
jgi:hypothetical protein